MLWEAMVAEMRAKQADVDSRRHFSAEGARIVDTREVIDQWVTPDVTDLETVAAHSATGFTQAAESGFIEVG